MKKLIKYLIVIGVGLAIFAFVVLTRNIFSQTEIRKIYIILSDGFFIPGVLITCFGLLVFTSNQGSFDMIVYGLQMFINKFRRNINARKHKSFYEYREAKREDKKSFGYICLVGLCFIALSAVFTFLRSRQ